MIQLLIMKNTVSIFAIMAIAFCATCAHASECIDEDCEFEPSVVAEIISEEPEEYIEENTEFLEPELPEIILWSAKEERIEEIPEQTFCEPDYNCPFDTAKECEVWYKKPIYSESVAPRAPHLNTLRTDDILYEIYSNPNYCANDEVFEPFADVTIDTDSIIRYVEDKLDGIRDEYDIKSHEITLTAIPSDGNLWVKVELSFTYIRSYDGKLSWNTAEYLVLIEGDYINPTSPTGDYYMYIEHEYEYDIGTDTACE